MGEPTMGEMARWTFYQRFIAEQERSDVVHDLLAFLAKRMLEMNRQKQQEIRGF